MKTDIEASVAACSAELRFADFRLAGPHGPLWRSNAQLDLPKKPLAVLWLLTSRAGEVVTKDELLAAAWPRVVVTEGAIAATLRDLRRALGDDAQQPRFIATAHRIGYRFIAQVTRQGRSDEQLPPSAADTTSDSAPAVGRVVERATLQNAYAQALAGRRQIVFVTGEAGIGKSFLVDQFLASLRRDMGVHAVRAGHGQCIEHYGEGEPYLPILEAVTRLCRQSGTPSFLALLRQHAPTWLAQLPGLAVEADDSAARPASSPGSAQRMLREMAEAIDAAAADEPLVLVFEDMHWSDRSTVDWLAMLARRREPAKLLVLATCRPVELIVHEHPLKPVKQDLVARALASEIVLGRLSTDDVRVYVKQRLPDRPAAFDLGTTVHQRSQGLPLFMVHMANDLQQSGASITYEEGSSLPKGIGELLDAQLSRLVLGQIEILEAASVIGADFAATTVAAALQRPLEMVEPVLEALAQHLQFIEPRGLAEWQDGTVSGRYAFRHDLYRESLYRRLSATRRVRLHALVGERLEAAYGTSSIDIAAELALHYEHARNRRRAALHRRAAGEKALQRYAYREALDHATHGLGLLKPPAEDRGDPLELKLRLTQGAALLAIRGFGAPEIEVAYQRVLSLGIQLDDRGAIGPALSGLYNAYLTRAAFERVRAIADQVFDIVAHNPEEKVLSMLAHNVRGSVLLFEGHVAVSLPHVDSTLAQYDFEAHRRLAATYAEDPAVASHHYAALACWITGDPTTAASHIVRGIELAQRLQHPFGQAQMLWMEALICLDGGDVDRVDQLTSMLTGGRDDDEFPLWLAGGRILRGGALAARGKLDEAVSMTERGLSAWRAAGTLLTLPHALAVMARVQSLGGRTEEALRFLGEALAIVRQTGERWYEAELHRLQSEMLLRLPGALDNGARRAQTGFERAIDVSRRQGAKLFEWRARASLAALCGSTEPALEALSRLGRAGDEFRDARNHRADRRGGANDEPLVEAAEPGPELQLRS